MQMPKFIKNMLKEVQPLPKCHLHSFTSGQSIHDIDFNECCEGCPMTLREVMKAVKKNCHDFPDKFDYSKFIESLNEA